jgi:Spy/CpxP family protein refolding chaperone
MHPRMMSCCSTPRGWRSGWSERGRDVHHFAPPGLEGGSAFGVRRPLRFLAWKLGLSDAQITELAAVLNELKTERAQAEVDDRRALALLADVIGGDAFDEARAREASELRVRSHERLQAQVGRAMSRLHALLDSEQRGRLAYLIRTGAVAL